MQKADSFAKSRLWICGLGGLLLGALSQQLFLHPEPTPAAGDSAEIAANPQRRPARSPDRGDRPAGSGTRRLQQIVEADAAACEQWVIEILQAHDPSRRMELETAFRRWMSFEKPLVVLERIKELAEPPPNPGNTPPEWLIPDWASSFFKAWAATNYADAIASSEETKMFRDVRLLPVVEHRDPAIWSYFSKENANLDYAGTIQSALFQLGYERSVLLKSLVTDDISREVRKGLVASIAGGWAAADPAAANVWVRSLNLTEAERKEALGAVVDQWVKLDPIAAAASIQPSEVGISNRSLDILASIEQSQLRLAATADPFIDIKGLYEKLSQNHAEGEPIPQNHPAINFRGWYTPDPATAAREAEALPPGEIRDFLLLSIADIWAADDPRAGKEFAQRNGIESRYLKETLDDETMAQIISDPAAMFAGHAVSQTFISGSKEDLLRDELHTWARIDPEAAAELALEEWSTSEDGLTLVAREFFNIVGYSWAKHDVGSAIEWMETLPNEAGKARAWGAIREYAKDYSPELLFDVSAQNFHGEEKERLLRSSLSSIRTSIGEPAALAHLESANLSEQERQSLRQFLLESE